MISISKHSGWGNFEAVILEGNDLVHYWRDDSSPSFTWHRGAIITSTATGPGSLIRSTFKSNSQSPGNFELIVPEGQKLVHYWHDNSTSGRPWQKTVPITTTVANGPGTLMQSTGSPGNLEMVVWNGGKLTHWQRNNSVSGLPWAPTADITSTAAGPGCIIQSTSATANVPGNFEVLVLEMPHNLVHYWRDNTVEDTPWRRGVTISTVAIG